MLIISYFVIFCAFIDHLYLVVSFVFCGGLLPRSRGDKPPRAECILSVVALPAANDVNAGTTFYYAKVGWVGWSILSLKILSPMYDILPVAGFV